MAPSTSTNGLFQRLGRWLGPAASASRPVAKATRKGVRSLPSPRRKRAEAAEAWMPPQSVSTLSPMDLRLEVRAAVLRDRDRILSYGGAVARGDAAFLERLAHTLASESLALPVFPEVALELARLLRVGDPARAEVVRLVTREPDLLRRVWKRANCSLYRVPVTDIDRAIARIGYDEVWRIGMSVCLQGEVFRAGRYQKRVEDLRSAGVVAGSLTAWVDQKPRGEGYLAGLMQAAGAMFILRHASLDRRNPPSAGALQHALHQYQTAFSVLMVRTWTLGDRVAAAVGHYPQPAGAPESDRDFVEGLRIGVLGAHVGRATLRACRDTDDRVLLKAYVGTRVKLGELLKRAERGWRAEGEGEPMVRGAASGR